MKRILCFVTILVVIISSFAPVMAQNIATIAGSGTYGFSGDSAVATLASLTNPTGITKDLSGNIYFSDAGNNRVRKISSTGIITTVAGTGIAGYSGDGGLATAAELNDPAGLTTDSLGNLYIADALNNCIRKVSTTGVIITIAGTGTSGYSGDGGDATAAELNYPSDVAIDTSGTIYEVEESNRVRKISPAGVISLVAGTGVTGFSGDGGDATAAQFNQSTAIELDDTGNIYIADTYNGRIRKINTSGIISTFAGTSISGFSGDGGLATSAELFNPTGLSLDRHGNLFIADNSNCRIRKVNAAGYISTVAGTGTAGFSGDGGLATLAKLKYPFGVFTDAANNVFIADQNNYRIREIQDCTPYIAAIGGPTTICTGVPVTLTDSVSPGRWASDDTSIAKIDSVTGVVTGYTTGTTTIRYKVVTACWSDSTSVSIVVNPTLDAGTITGADSLCVGSATTLTDDGSGGVWISQHGYLSVYSGVVTGLTPGTDTVFYIASNVCGHDSALKSVTVVALPTANITSPTFTGCPGNSYTLTAVPAGGAWTSSSTPTAAIDHATGAVTPISTGIVTMNYILINYCGSATDAQNDTIVVLSPITGAAIVCSNDSILLSDASVGGIWSSSNSNATVTSNGRVSGASMGSAMISYTFSPICYSTYNVTVNPAPAGITGTTTICQYSSTTLTDPSTGGAWSNNDGSVATVDVSGQVTGVNGGTTIVSYSYANGCFASVPVVVHTMPTALTGTTSLCAGATSPLAVTPTGGIWTSTATSVATVNSAGVVTATGAGTAIITYNLAGCKQSIDISVDPSPSAVITPIGDTMLCTGGFAVLTAATGTALTYQWYNGTIPVPGATTSYYNVTDAGIYKVNVGNSIGCISVSPGIHVTVNPVSATATAAGATTICSSSSVMLHANTGIGLSYQWQHDGVGITGATNATYPAFIAGDYRVVVSNTAGCSELSPETISVSVLPSPTGTLTLSGPAAFCAGSTLTITAIDSAGLIYQWYNGTSPISGATDNAYAVTTAGTYKVQITNSEPCSVTPSVTATEVALPDASISAAGALTFCYGTSVTLNATPLPGSTYQWYNTGSAITGATNSSYVAVISGDYTAMITSPDGCSNISSMALTALEVSEPAVIPLTDAAFCWGSSALLALNVGDVPGLGFQWQKDGVNIGGATNNTLNVGESGEYSCTISLPSCSDASSALTVTEHPLPDPVVTYDGELLGTGSYITYQWYKGMAIISGATSATFHPVDTGVYEVKVTDYNGCQSISPAYTVTHVDLAVISIEKGSIIVYPNPATNMVYVQAGEPLKAVLCTIDGRTVLTQKDAATIDISSLNSGVYTLMLYSNAGQMVKAEKLVKE